MYCLLCIFVVNDRVMLLPCQQSTLENANEISGITVDNVDVAC